MVSDMRRQGMPLHEISKKITDQCCQAYSCKDNVTLLIIDLSKHFGVQKQQKKRSMEEARVNCSETRQRELSFFNTPAMPFEEQLKPYWSPQMGHPGYVVGNHSPNVCNPKLKNLKPMGQFSHPC